jgi:hypothetical protein
VAYSFGAFGVLKVCLKEVSTVGVGRVTRWIIIKAGHFLRKRRTFNKKAGHF